MPIFRGTLFTQSLFFPPRRRKSPKASQNFPPSKNPFPSKQRPKLSNLNGTASKRVYLISVKLASQKCGGLSFQLLCFESVTGRYFLPRLTLFGGETMLCPFSGSMSSSPLPPTHFVNVPIPVVCHLPLLGTLVQRCKPSMDSEQPLFRQLPLPTRSTRTH